MDVGVVEVVVVVGMMERGGRAVPASYIHAVSKRIGRRYVMLVNCTISRQAQVVQTGSDCWGTPVSQLPLST